MNSNYVSWLVLNNHWNIFSEFNKENFIFIFYIFNCSVLTIKITEKEYKKGYDAMIIENVAIKND